MDILLRTTLQAVRSGEMGVDEACDRLAGWSHESLPFATSDHHRALRSGFPEVVYCAGKTPAQAAAIARRVWERSGRMLATRAGGEHARAVVAAVPEARHNPVARTVSAGEPAATDGPPVLVVTAGTSDLPVAEEAVETVRMLGQPVETLVDVGVAGVHRLLAHESALTRAGVVIVVAGMEGLSRRSSAASFAPRSSPCRPAWATGHRSRVSRPSWPCSRAAPRESSW